MSPTTRTEAVEELAVAMAEEGFAVPASNRDEQWDAPYAEAARILEKLAAGRRSVNQQNQIDADLGAAWRRARDGAGRDPRVARPTGRRRIVDRPPESQAARGP